METKSQNFDALAFLTGMLIGEPFAFRLYLEESYMRFSFGMLVFIFVIVPLISQRRIFCRVNSIFKDLFMAFLVWGTLVLLISIIRGFAVSGLKSFFYQFFIFSHLFLGIRLLRSYNSILSLLFGIVIITALTGIIVITTQDLAGSWASLYRSKVQYMDLDVESSQHMEDYTIVGWPNNYAVFLGAGILFAFHLFSRSKPLWQKATFVIIMLEFLIVMLLTFSRTGLMSFFIAVFWATSFSDKKLFQTIKIAFLLCTCIFLAVWYVSELSTLLADNFTYTGSLGVRFELFSRIFEMSSPLSYFVGNGFRSMEAISPEVGSFSVFVIQSAHNDFLSMFIRAGIPGLILYCWILYECYRSLLTGIKANSVPEIRGFLKLWAGVSLGFFVAGITAEIMRFWPVSATYFLISGGLLGILGNKNNRQQFGAIRHL